MGLYWEEEEEEEDDEEKQDWKREKKMLVLSKVYLFLMTFSNDFLFR